jgi:hypothetical protein
VPLAGVEPVIARLKDEHPGRWTTGASPSPRPGLNRSLPLTGRALVHRAARARRSSGRNRTSESPVNSRLPDHSASLENGRGAGASRPPVVWRRVVKERCPRAEGKRIRAPERRAVRAVSGAGIEPALPVSEASVLPLDDPESKLGLRRPGGARTLASPGKSRVRCRYATSLLSCGWDARDSNPHPSG